MRVVFLDIDGVLNSADYLYSLRRRPGTHKIDPLAVQRLNRITDATGAVIFVSSTWRIMGLKAIRTLLREHGVTAKIVGVTPDDNRIRGLQIAQCINTHDVDAYVILDDDADMGRLMSRLVQTDFDHGLTDEHAARAIAVLRKTRRRRALVLSAP
jgi:hypothetical protein